MATSDWLVGAWQNAPAFAFTVNGNAKAIAADDWYLYDATASISLISKIESLVQEEYGSATVTITKSGRVKFSNGTAMTIAWGSDTTLRDRLGHTGDISLAETVGANRTRYLWRSGTTHSPMLGSLGSAGARRTDGAYAMGPNVLSQTFHNSWSENDIEFGQVANARFETKDQNPGEYATFDADVVDRGYRFKLYRKVDEDETTTDVTWPTGADVLGPYALNAPPDGRRFQYNRFPGTERVDYIHTVRLQVRTYAELT